MQSVRSRARRVFTRVTARRFVPGSKARRPLSADPLGGRRESHLKIDLAESDDAILACCPVMQSLRELDDASSFLRRVRSQQGSGYRLAALSDGAGPIAVAGFRLSESLAWGHHLYVDDLATLPEARSKGYGAALLSWLAEFARSKGAHQLHLDSGTQREDAHRFYRREGLEVSSLHFNRTL